MSVVINNLSDLIIYIAIGWSFFFMNFKKWLKAAGIRAIKTFCQKEYNDDELSERFEQSWRYQLDNLRKSGEYRGGDSNEERNH